MESVGQGILGLALFISHWFMPLSDRAKLDIGFDRYDKNGAMVFVCKMDPAWNEKLEQLVDAGIPLRFKFQSYGEGSDTTILVRSLHYNIAKYTYHVNDSNALGRRNSKQYPMVLLALRDYCKWEIKVPPAATHYRAEACILPSKAERLNKMVDMSRVWGQQRVYVNFEPQKIAKKRQNK